VDKNLFGFKDARIFLRTNSEKENTCIEFLSSLVGNDVRAASVNKKKLRSLIENYSVKLSEKQAAAVSHAVEQNFTGVIGPVGSGKKTTLRTILEILRKFYPRNHIEVLAANDEMIAELKSETPNVSYETFARALGMRGAKKKNSKPAQVLVIFGAEFLTLDYWHSLFTSPRVSVLQKLILFGDTDLEFFGKSHLLWNFFSSGKTKTCEFKLDDFSDTNSGISVASSHILSGTKARDLIRNIANASGIEIKVIGREQSEWRSEIGNFLRETEKTRDSSVLFVPNRRYKDRLNRLCQQVWNKQSEDVECTLIRDEELVLKLTEDRQEDKDDVVEIGDREAGGERVREKEREVMKDQGRKTELSGYERTKSVKRVRMADRVIWRRHRPPRLPGSPIYHLPILEDASLGYVLPRSAAERMRDNMLN
jgi:hypothetical protein